MWMKVEGVLDVGRDVALSFVRKMKATQKMGASGLCMLCVVSVISMVGCRSPPLIREGVFKPATVVSVSQNEERPQKTKEKKTRLRGPKGNTTQTVHQRQLLRRHLQQLFELQEPEAELRLTVRLDFG